VCNNKKVIRCVFPDSLGATRVIALLIKLNESILNSSIKTYMSLINIYVTKNKIK
jgi:hypothetical protein